MFRASRHALARFVMSGFAAIALAAAMSTAAQNKARDINIGLQAAITSMDPHFHNLSPNNYRQTFGGQKLFAGR